MIFSAYHWTFSICHFLDVENGKRKTSNDKRKIILPTANCLLPTASCRCFFGCNATLGYIHLRQLAEGSHNGSAAVLKTAGRKAMQVRVLSPPPSLFNDLHSYDHTPSVPVPS